MQPAPRVSVSGLAVERFGRLVLDCCELSLEKGEWVDMRGPSGSGKSSLLLAIARLIPRKSGELFLNRVSEHEVPLSKWRTRVVWCPQTPVYLPGSVYENLMAPFRFGANALRDIPTIADIRARLDRLGLQEVSFENLAGRLSGGQLARLAVLRASLLEPELFLLDEPDAMLDDKSSEQVSDYLSELRNEGTTVLRVCHRPTPGANRELYMESGILK